MFRYVSDVLAAVVAGAALGTLGVTGTGPSGAATRGAPVNGLATVTPHRPAVPGARLWAARYNGHGKGFDVARSVAAGPGGRVVFVTGYSAGATSGEDYLTLAYDAATGARLWTARYNGPGNGLDEGHSVAVSPSGRTVFVTGTSAGTTSEQDYATVAYNAATGARLWVSRYNGPGNSYDDAARVVVSPGGATVVVTGLSAGTTSFDYATVAYSARTGARLWASRYNGPGNRYDEAHSIAISPSGRTVFVTGYSARTRSGTDAVFDYATIAYSARTGARLWVSRYNGPGNYFDEAWSVAVSPTGGTVFVTGTSFGVTSGLDYATIAYRAATGARLWVSRYNGPGDDLDAALSVASSPGGRTVFVTGLSAGTTSSLDYATIAYRATTGARLWVSRYNGPGNSIDAAQSIAISPAGGTVFVTGQSTGITSGRDYATIAYRATTGAQSWVRRYNGPGNNFDQPWSVAVSPAGRKVFVTGESVGTTSGFDYATIAYAGGPGW